MKHMRKYSIAFIYDYSEDWGEIEGFSEYSEAVGFARGD